jgi:hypothetical protein
LRACRTEEKTKGKTKVWDSLPMVLREEKARVSLRSPGGIKRRGWIDGLSG